MAERGVVVHLLYPIPYHWQDGEQFNNIIPTHHVTRRWYLFDTNVSSIFILHNF